MKTIRIVEGMEFTFRSPVKIEEAVAPRAIITGVLLREGVSRNGRLYTVDEMQHIAEQAVDLPIEYGVDRQGKHKAGNKIGRILRAWLDEAKRKIFFVAEIFGGVVRNVRKGWCVSIDGRADGNYVLTETGKVLLKVSNMIFQKLQLLPPTSKGGVIGAQIHDVKLMESMEFKTPFSNTKIAAIIAALRAKGEL